MRIESKENEKVKEWTRLNEDKKYRSEKRLFLVEGDHLLKEALQSNLVVSVITTEETKYPVETFLVTEAIMKKMSQQISPPKVIGVCKMMTEQEIKGAVLVLDDIQDPGNLGTMIRSAVAFHVPNIILSLKSVDFYNPKVIRSTEGMLFHVNMIRTDLKIILPELKKLGYVIMGSDVVNGCQVEDVKVSSKYALVIGSEGQGMSEEVRRLCDMFLYIPMDSLCESLNASISASLFMYELGKVNHE